MVRLKDTPLDEFKRTFFEFQFLMVRLKVELLEYKDLKKKVISIPYGAIKRKFHLSKNYQKLIISIPYGAIKSLREVGIIGSPRPFQFLMVRLKVNFDRYSD